MTTSTAPAAPSTSSVPRLPDAGDLPKLENTASYGLTPAQAARIYCLRGVRDQVTSNGRLDPSDPGVLITLARYVETGRDPRADVSSVISDAFKGATDGE